MTSKQNKEWLHEYEEFLNHDLDVVPESLSTQVLSSVHQLLYPNAWKIFGKLLVLHMVIGTLSLAICHQFGLNPFQTSFSMDNWFMGFVDHHGCMVLCGVLFISLTLIAAGWLFKLEELRAIQRKAPLHVGALSLFSIGLFFAAGAEITLTLGGLWILGGLIGGCITSLAAFGLKRIPALHA